ncbi:circadian clock-controlled protein daywake-like [Condylostylus longicornis]|uniref:circadian clock-controlled protein daywake-like n=1 Tax=Condylostylus longicornis TaxID=2530218 RepID=UPI00244E2478|nr:circadian clock-controlled protein daywake-like [Condylostylus longicornis]
MCKIIVVTLLFLLGCCHGNELAEYIKPCNKSDPYINVCIRNSFNHLKNYLPNGISELNVPPLEPLIIDELVMENNAGAIRVKAKFSSIIAKGASNYVVKEVRSDITKLRFDLSLGLPLVEVFGKYDVNGNVLLLPVRSNGNFWAEFGNVTTVARVYGVEKIKNGIKVLHIGKLAIDFSLKHVKLRVEDTINSGNILGEAINQFLNVNAQELVKEMKPAASRSIAKLFQKILNNAFSKIGMDDWLHQ